MVGWEVIAILCAVTGLYGIRLAAGVIQNEYRIACTIRRAENRIRAQKTARRSYSRRLAKLDEKARLEREQSSG